jgi:L-ascorbate metabolism protein UlaG (beta-lactamase superfamily)
VITGYGLLMEQTRISRDKQKAVAVGLIGGSTVVLDYGGLRLVTDPTFDPPGSYGPLTKTEGPALSPDEIGDADAVLLSHEDHADNFDHAGRRYAAQAGRTITGTHAAQRLAGNAVGLEPWQTSELTRPTGEVLTVTAVPADHGPRDGARDQWNNINCEVIGFVITSDDLPSLYVSGDNASIERVSDVAARFPQIDIAVLFTGAARVDFKDQGRPLTLTAERAADATLLLNAETVVAAHFRGWKHFSQTPGELTAAFTDAGIADRLHVPEPGVWTVGDLA